MVEGQSFSASLLSTATKPVVGIGKYFQGKVSQSDVGFELQSVTIGHGVQLIAKTRDFF